ncbi:hypothetical protein [Trujillonella humicola]|uniref:hypothetical protein n=1 Tax=Trujillonella humicola TaxID=3383699 RepID=UPI003906B785
MTVLQPVAQAAALVVTAAALLAGALALAVTRDAAPALAVLLDLLLAAGLLRLTGAPGWGALATAAAVLALRHLIGYGLRLSRASSGPPAGTRGRPATPRRPPGLRDLLRPAWRG